MPMYLYQCHACDHEFETFQSLTADNPVCVKCGNNTRRLINGKTAFALKGVGWSKDNYEITQQHSDNYKSVMKDPSKKF